MESYGNVVIPEVHDDYSTKNVLTMEYIPGIKVTNIEELDKKGIDRQKLVIDVHKIFFYDAFAAFDLPRRSTSRKHLSQE